MGALNIPVQIKTASASGQVPTSLLPGELGLDPWLGRIWWLDNTGTKQFAALPGIAAAAQITSDLNVAQQNIAYQGLLLASLRNVPTGIVDGIIDPFSSTADINTGASSGYTFTSSAGTIGATVTTSTAQSASYAIASSSNTSYPASQAFDGNTSSYWYCADANASGISYIGQDFGSGNTKTITSSTIIQYNSPNNQVTSALFQYADALSGPWTTVATVALSGAAQATANVPSGSGAHRFWRWLANSATQPSYPWTVAEVTMTAAPSTAAMVLQSATLASAVASPSAMRGLIALDSTSVALTPNTDVTVALSRDGATFTTGTLATVQTMPDGSTVLDTGWTSVTGQPTGNSTMTYLLKTPTQKAAVFTGASMMVRP